MASTRNQKKTQKVANDAASQEVANVPMQFARMTTPQFKSERVEAQAPNVTLALAQAFGLVEESAEPSLERMSTEEFKEMREMAREAKEEEEQAGEASIEALKIKPVSTKDQAAVALRCMKTKAEEGKDKAILILHDPQFQTCTIATAGGAITFGAVGGSFGAASGVVLGSAAGVVPALFTFGLSIPIGGAMGGVAGGCTGTLVGSSAGGIGGFTTYKYRVELKNGVMVVKVKAQDTLNLAKDKSLLAISSTKSKIGEKVYVFRTAVSNLKNKSFEAVDFGKGKALKAVDFSKGKASEAISFASTTKVGVTSSAALAGAVVGGTTTGAFGTVAGAAVGLPLALFTFGLSIPVCAVAGLCVGTTVGGSAGAVGGGAVGYGGFTHRKAISEGVHSSWSKVSGKADQIKTAAFAYAGDAKESLRPRSHSTGGSDIK